MGAVQEYLFAPEFWPLLGNGCRRHCFSCALNNLETVFAIELLLSDRIRRGVFRRCRVKI
jgi:hypothetical protein